MSAAAGKCDSKVKEYAPEWPSSAADSAGPRVPSEAHPSQLAAWRPGQRSWRSREWAKSATSAGAELGRIERQGSRTGWVVDEHHRRSWPCWPSCGAASRDCRARPHVSHYAGEDLNFYRRCYSLFDLAHTRPATLSDPDDSARQSNGLAVLSSADLVRATAWKGTLVSPSRPHDEWGGSGLTKHDPSESSSRAVMASVM